MRPNAGGSFAGNFQFDDRTGEVVALPPGVTIAQVHASLDANPKASKGGYEGAPATNATPTVGPTIDFANFLGMYGLPPDVQTKLSEIFANTPDAATAAQLSLAYVRGTQWYKDTYPGIQDAIAKGIVGNEADYRALLNQQNQVYQQYYGRDITGHEFTQNLATGADTATLGRRFAGAAYVSANKTDVQYTLGAYGDTGQANDAELKALGEENAGIDTPLGQLVKKRLEMAQQRLNNVASGTLANPSLSLSGGRLAASSLDLSGGHPDIAA